MLGTETSRSASLALCDVAEVSIEDPSFSLAEPSYSKAFIESTHLISNCLPYRHSSLAIVNVVSDPTTYHTSSPIFAFLCNRAQPT